METNLSKKTTPEKTVKKVLTKQMKAAFQQTKTTAQQAMTALDGKPRTQKSIDAETKKLNDKIQATERNIIKAQSGMVKAETDKERNMFYKQIGELKDELAKIKKSPEAKQLGTIIDRKKEGRSKTKQQNIAKEREARKLARPRMTKR